jgi:hypothetical protein
MRGRKFFFLPPESIEWALKEKKSLRGMDTTNLDEWRPVRWFGVDGRSRPVVGQIERKPVTAFSKPSSPVMPSTRCGWLASDDTGDVDHVLLRDLNFRGAFHGYDREGRPVYYMDLGQVDLSGLQGARAESICMGIKRHAVLTFLAMKDRAPTSLQQGTIVCNLYGIGWQHMTPAALRLIRDMVDLYQTWFPDAAGHILLVNPPLLMPLFWGMIHPLLPNNLSRLVHIVQGHYEPLNAHATLLDPWIQKKVSAPNA